jgi:hypothetical protein
MRYRRPVILLAAATIIFILGLAAHGEQPARAMGTNVSPAAVDTLLDGGDWRMGSFDLGAGEKAGASAEKFDDSGFRTVTVPSDTQLQAGFTGLERFNESKELIAVNGKEWWYRKHFHAGAKASGAVSRIVFDGLDYFTTV